MEIDFDIIDAFVDGERVDPSELKRALSEDAGRQHLIDAWLIRDCVQEEMALDAVLPPPTRAVRTGSKWRSLMLAAACVGGGVIVGAMMPRGTIPAPEATPAPAAAQVAARPQPASFPVPTATRIIRVEVAVKSAPAS